jgi:hypothetical protein
LCFFALCGQANTATINAATALSQRCCEESWVMDAAAAQSSSSAAAAYGEAAANSNTGGDDERPVKVCVVGPTGSGKSLLCAALAGQLLSPTAPFGPTAGVRIQEVAFRDPASAPSPPDDRPLARAQLWDVGGDAARYAGYWPLLAAGADGAILVVDAAGSAGSGGAGGAGRDGGNGGSSTAELEALYAHFAPAAAAAAAKQCFLVIALERSGAIGGAAAAWPGVLNCSTLQVLIPD